MPDQLDVHRNPGKNKSAIPFVVVVQSNRFRDAARRVVVPLLAAGVFGPPDSDVGPHFVIDGRTVVLDPLQITNVPRAVLGPPVALLTKEDDRIMKALDILLSRAWRWPEPGQR
jgi:toxin CcdB